MSKVDTLLKLIAYQKQHPQASDEEIAQGIGISSRQVRRCQKEVNLLKHQLAEPTLQPGQIQFMLSLLNRREPDQKEIARQLQKQMGVSYTGILRTKQPDEQAPLSWLEIGELSSSLEVGSLEHPDPIQSQWLYQLCYDPLLMSYWNGEIEGRLAIGCEPVKENSQWQLRKVSGFFCGESYLCQRRDTGRGGCLFNSTPFWLLVHQPTTILPFRWRTQLFRLFQSPS